MKTIAIFCHGQAGDLMTATSVLRYKNELWGEDCKIVWYADRNNFDLLAHQDIEAREFPRGFGHPAMTITENKKLVDAGKEPVWQDWRPLVDRNNHMNLELKGNYPSLADIDYGYFPAPHQMSPAQRHGLDYPSCSKKVFGVPDHYEWHPYLYFSKDEIAETSLFVEKLGRSKVVAIESFAGSGQSKMDSEMIAKTMDICRENWPGCKFLFMSHKFLKDCEKFPEGLFNSSNIFSCANFSVRKCALICEQTDLMISVSSGITVAASAWYIDQPPTLQFTGSWVCSTKTLANGPFELVTYDGKKLADAKNVYYEKLVSLLNQYK